LAEDAVQETLLRMWKHLPSLRRGDNLKAWLVRIVVNEVNCQRRKKRVPTIPLEYAPEIVDDCEDAASAMIRDEDRQNVRQALDILPSGVREIVILRYFSELGAGDRRRHEKAGRHDQVTPQPRPGSPQ
jgi:RNA polymerase sigma-70 factor (ECF subfamily)